MFFSIQEYVCDFASKHLHTAWVKRMSNEKWKGKREQIVIFYKTAYFPWDLGKKERLLKQGTWKNVWLYM